MPRAAVVDGRSARFARLISLAAFSAWGCLVPQLEPRSSLRPSLCGVFQVPHADHWHLLKFGYGVGYKSNLRSD
jgi:hypothetical protein